MRDNVNLNDEERQIFSAFLENQAEINAVKSAMTKFDVAPSVQQKLIDAQGLNSEFLSKTNLVLVPELKGEALYLDDDQMIASRTDTTGDGERKPFNISAMDKIEYELSQTDYDTALPYKQIRMWVKFADYQVKLSNYIARIQARSRIKIAFNGTHAADTTNRTNNPMGQDVNIGWLEKIRLWKSGIYAMDHGAAPGKVTFGANGDYNNLDALVFDAVENLIAEEHRDREDLVVICGRKLLNDKYFPLINKDTDAQNQLARDIIISQKRVGNLPAVRVPYFPANKVLITALSNLSIYEQEGQRHKYFKDNPTKNRYENYEDVPDAFVVENHDVAALVENIEEAD